MPVTHEIANEPLIVLHMLGARAITHPRGLHDGGIVAHIVDHPDKAMIEHGIGGVEMLFHPCRRGAQGALALRALRVDFGLLVGAEGHGEAFHHKNESEITISWGSHTRQAHIGCLPMRHSGAVFAIRGCIGN